MTRTLTPAMETEVTAQRGEAVYLLSFDFSGGVLYWNTGSADIAWDGQTWEAIGGAVTFEGLAETANERGQGVRLSLPGVDVEIIAALLTNDYVGRPVNIYLAHLDASGAVIDDPVGPWTMLMNGDFKVEESREREGGTCNISTRVVSRLNSLKKKSGIRMNPASHQKHFAGDKFMEFVSEANRPIYWGIEPPADTSNRGSTGSEPGSGGGGDGTGPGAGPGAGEPWRLV